MYYVYLLKSEKDHNYYIGQTKSIHQRLKEHISGKVTSTKYRRPIILIGFEVFTTQNEARFKEYSLKKSAHQRKAFIKKLESNQDNVASLWPYGP